MKTRVITAVALLPLLLLIVLAAPKFCTAILFAAMAAIAAYELVLPLRSATQTLLVAHTPRLGAMLWSMVERQITQVARNRGADTQVAELSGGVRPQLST